MTAPTNTVTTYVAVGIRESLEDVIYDISPTDYPIMSNIGRDGAAAIFEEWQTDLLRAPKRNKVDEGQDSTNSQRDPTVRPGNYMQLSDEVIGVSSSQRAVNTAGRSDELAYQMAKALEEIKRDIEYCIGRNFPANGADTRESAGIECWIATNALHGATGSTPYNPANPGAPTVAPTDGTPRPLTSALFGDAVELAWTEGGSPDMVVANGKVKRGMSTGFKGVATRFRDVGPGEQAQIIGAADLYVSDFGFNQSLVPSRWTRTAAVDTVSALLILDPSLWAIAWLQPIQSVPLAKAGHSDRELVFGEWTLKSRNQRGNAKVADLNDVVTADT